MPRVKQAEVKAIIATDEIDIEPFVTVANIFVTEELGSSGLSASRLKEIERWLTAHLLALKDPDLGSLVEEAAGSGRNRYSSAGFGEGLKMTRYGQQVLLLDTTGTLASSAKTRARFTVVTEI